MNVVISGPFGAGSFSDEIVLAGLLRHLAKGQHSVTVLSADPDAIKAQHGVEAVKLSGPTALHSTKPAWAVLERCHLFIVAGAGVLGAEGKVPARAWLAAFEPAKKVGRKTAVVGIGAQPIDDAKERVRLQRLLHHYADCISARDDESKQVLIGYGINANRISTHGDLAFALAKAEGLPASVARRVGIILAPQLPARRGFSLDPAVPNEALVTATRDLLDRLTGPLNCEVVFLHDATPEAQTFATAALDGKAGASIRVQRPDAPFAELQGAVAGCQTIVSFTLHGLFLATACGVPAVSLATEPGAAGFMERLGAGRSAISPTDETFSAEAVAAAVEALITDDVGQRDRLRERAAVLVKKEAHNMSMLHAIVPKRDRYPVDESRLSQDED